MRYCGGPGPLGAWEAVKGFGIDSHELCPCCGEL